MFSKKCYQWFNILFLTIYDFTCMYMQKGLAKINNLFYILAENTTSPALQNSARYKDERYL